MDAHVAVAKREEAFAEVRGSLANTLDAIGELQRPSVDAYVAVAKREDAFVEVRGSLADTLDARANGSTRSGSCDVRLWSCPDATQFSTTPLEEMHPAPTTTTHMPAPAGGATVAGLNGENEYLVCLTCHQADGKGLAGVYPPLAGSEYVNGDPSIPIAIILHGLQREIQVAGQSYNAVMAPWAQLSYAQIAVILSYERASWGNTGGAVTPEQVAKVRSATSSRSTAWTMPNSRRPS